ncbi:MAG: fused MFS/spermidine synthase [Candidatus Eisenbacteria bacterium]|uniref:Fused MFS/spermidine synthase n=1 Tax=Eiseniibacteriota bacterium TaxID=2212470 RepID=A0A933SA30_UNCEI|nr:fused MFS/spermidine synthase [Candidatus Eisenbacteria bacterium]
MPKPASSPSRSSSLPLWAAACFFVSGAAGLLYEIVWSKQLAYVLGSSLHAVATVAAAFLCGLAIGARVLGGPLSRRGDGARLYALLEFGVAVLGVALLPLLRGVEPVFGHFYRTLGADSALFAVVRFLLTFVVLLPPTVLMGATLPVLVEHFEKDLVGPALARLYAVNTFGAVAGSALAGFVFMPTLGLARTTYVAAAFNLAAGALAWFAGGAPARSAPPAAVPVPAAPAAPAPSVAPVAVLFALSGFAALAFQIAWVRLFSLVFGSSVYSFAGVLGVYLFGLALGSAAVSFALRRGASLALFARLQWALALSAAAGLHYFGQLPDRMLELSVRSGTSWAALFTGQIVLVGTLLLVPCALLGALFPVATRLLQRGHGGDAAGFAYAVNTAGTLAGSLTAGFLLVPALGVQGTHVAALALSAAIALAALALGRSRREIGTPELAVGFGATVIAGFLVWGAPAWNPTLMSAGVFRPVRADELQVASRANGGEGSVVQRAVSEERLLFYREGANATVLVGSDASSRKRWLKVGGKVDASTTDMETQVLLGLIPAATADSGARTLVIGLGSGFTASAALAAGAGRMDVVELERGVAEASEFFHESALNPLRDPRVTLTIGDARTLLEHTHERYGLIISEPSNPWLAGVNNLFTVDFYRRVRARLEPDGVFCQWMQLYEISPETIRSMMASFLEVFPEGDVYTVWRAVDVVLVAAPGGRKLSLDRLRSPEARRMLDAANIAQPEDVAGYWSAPLSALVPIARGAALNRDDLPLVEYRAPRDLVAVGRAALNGSPEVARLVPFEGRMSAGARFAEWDRASWHARRAQHLVALGDTVRARAAIAGARADGAAAVASELDGEVVAGLRRRQADAVLEQAAQLLALGRKDEGRRSIERAVEIDPTHARAWLMLADRLRVGGDLTGAERALARAPHGQGIDLEADAEVMRGMIAIARKDTATAFTHLLAAQEMGPKNPTAYLFTSRLYVVRDDLVGARRSIERGLEVLPGDPVLLQILEALKQQ